MPCIMHLHVRCVVAKLIGSDKEFIRAPNVTTCNNWIMEVSWKSHGKLFRLPGNFSDAWKNQVGKIFHRPGEIFRGLEFAWKTGKTSSTRFPAGKKRARFSRLVTFSLGKNGFSTGKNLVKRSGNPGKSPENAWKTPGRGGGCIHSAPGGHRARSMWLL